MAGTTIIIISTFVIFMIIALCPVRVKCRSLPVPIDRQEIVQEYKLRRFRRQGIKSGDLPDGRPWRGENEIRAEIEKTIPDGILCNIVGAKPDKKIPCPDGKYDVKWSLVDDGSAANISVYLSSVNLVIKY